MRFRIKVKSSETETVKAAASVNNVKIVDTFEHSDMTYIVGSTKDMASIFDMGRMVEAKIKLPTKSKSK